MNDYLFDRLTRGLATGASRRSLLKLMLTGAAGLAVGGALPTPTEAATLCPVRAPSGHPPVTNVCPPDVSVLWCPTLTPAFNKHDFCYSTCNSSKSTCDNQFLQNAYAACSNLSSIFSVSACKSEAYNAYTEMRLNNTAYVLAQQQVCVCCSAGQVVCGGRCVTNTCATGHVFSSTTCTCQ